MGKLLYAKKDGVFVIRLVGVVRLTLGPTIQSFLDELVQSRDFTAVVVDVADAESIDSTALGMLAKLAIRCREQFQITPTIVSPNPDITRILQGMGLQTIFVIAGDCDDLDCQCIERPTEIADEAQLKAQVIEAHRTLMAMNERNHDEFNDLVCALESEGDDKVSPRPARVGRP